MVREWGKLRVEGGKGMEKILAGGKGIGGSKSGRWYGTKGC